MISKERLLLCGIFNGIRKVTCHKLGAFSILLISFKISNYVDSLVGKNYLLFFTGASRL
jgi:hypothetical protein